MSTSNHIHYASGKTEEEDVVLGQLLQVILDDIWWLIAITAVFIVLAAAAYCFLAKPIYSADAHVRVEQSDNTSQALTQTQTGAAIGNSARPRCRPTPRSRSSRAGAWSRRSSQQCKLNFSVSPKTIPLLGSIAARLATPGVPGSRGSA